MLDRIIKRKKPKSESKKDLLEKIAELEQTVRTLKQDLIHDSLTGLKTRSFFDEEAQVFYEAAMSKHHGMRREWFGFRNISFVFIDVDHFKKINDTHGHFVGDGVLKAVAARVEEGVRKGDIVARWGGEEMVVALVGANEKNAREKAEAIRKSVEQLSFNNMPDMNVTISAGVASAMVDATYEETLQRADKALYEAKESGRNKVVTWSELNSVV